MGIQGQIVRRMVGFRGMMRLWSVMGRIWMSAEKPIEKKTNYLCNILKIK